MPDWWPLVRAAKFYGCNPWDLVKQSTFWMHVGNEAASAVARAENQSDYSARDAGGQP